MPVITVDAGKLNKEQKSQLAKSANHLKQASNIVVG